MKRLAALILALALMCALTVPALAANYQTIVLKDTTYTTSDLTNETLRPLTAATLLVDYMLAQNDASVMEQLADSDCYIAKYGNYHVDVYYPLTGGKYLNLFFCPTDGSVTIFSNASYGGASSQYTYYTVSAADLRSSMIDVVNALTSD